MKFQKLNKINMKNILLIAIAYIFIACSYGVSSSRTIENKAYLIFKETTKNYQLVDVKINDGKTFYAKPYNRGDKIPSTRVKKEKLNKASKGRIFSIPTGKNKISIFYNNEKIYEKVVFLNNQEVRTITLP